MAQVLMTKPSSPPSGTKARLLGLVCLAAGAAFGWFFALSPLQQAYAGAQRVELGSKIFILAPMLLVAGLFLLAGGGPVLAAFSGPPKGRQQHLIVWTMFAIAVLAGGLTWWWMDRELTALGYRFS